MFSMKCHYPFPFRYIARLGEFDLSTKNDDGMPVDMLIERKIVHENYVHNIILNDIAILKLKRSVPINGRFTVQFQFINSYQNI